MLQLPDAATERNRFAPRNRDRVQGAAGRVAVPGRRLGSAAAGAALQVGHQPSVLEGRLPGAGAVHRVRGAAHQDHGGGAALFRAPRSGGGRVPHSDAQGLARLAGVLRVGELSRVVAGGVRGQRGHRAGGDAAGAWRRKDGRAALHCREERAHHQVAVQLSQGPVLGPELTYLILVRIYEINFDCEKKFQVHFRERYFTWTILP